jgi:hypothetical protein
VPVSTDLRLASLDRRVAPVLGRDNPLIGALLSEDTCWQIARADWQSRKPRPWQLEQRRIWRAEGDVLEEKRARLSEQAEELGLAPATPTGRAPRRSAAGR